MSQGRAHVHTAHRRIRYANIRATVALFLALGGASYGASTLPKQQRVIAADRRRAGQERDLGANAVTSSKVKNRSLLKTDFKAGQLPAGPRGKTGPRGATGPRGPAGPKGAGLALM